VNFGPLTAEIGSGVWGTPTNFNGFRVLAALLYGTSSGRQPNFAAFSTVRHLYSAGRPSRWALAHVLVLLCFNIGSIEYRVSFPRYRDIAVVFGYSVKLRLISSKFLNDQRHLVCEK